jgi:predicted amidohydrolase
MKKLKLALIHLNIHHKQPEKNREVLIAMVSDAARQGARIIVGPELAVSGYSFSDRNDMADRAETETGPTLTALAELVRAFGIHVCIGLAEKDIRTNILYNSAFVLNPKGQITCRYRKINAESRWACPGDPRQDNTFETPWGRVGVLICSDSYYGLMPRVTALRGADLLIVPANWPPSGLDPRELWRARAMENGFFLAACNRTGVDLTMDCRQAPSCGFDPRGQILLDGKNSESQIFWLDLPLTSKGRLNDRLRRKCMAGRRPQYYHDCYLNLGLIKDLTAFLNLPQPGDLKLHCVVPHVNEHPADALERNASSDARASGSLYILPSFSYSDTALEKIARNARIKNSGVVTCNPDSTGLLYYTLQNSEELHHWRLPPWPFENMAAIPRMDFGPARLLLVPFEAIAHPELAVAAAKQGCDLALAPTDRLSPKRRLLAGARTIENLAIAVCARNGAGIWVTPEGHHRWEEVVAGPGGVCRYDLDTRRTRFKRFQDQIDFDVLLRQPPPRSDLSQDPRIYRNGGSK